MIDTESTVAIIERYPRRFRWMQWPSKEVQLAFIQTAHFRVNKAEYIEFFLSNHSFIKPSYEVLEELIKYANHDTIKLIKQHANYKSLAKVIIEAIDEARKE